MIYGPDYVAFWRDDAGRLQVCWPILLERIVVGTGATVIIGTVTWMFLVMATGRMT